MMRRLAAIMTLTFPPIRSFEHTTTLLDYSPGRVEDWRRCSVGPAYPLLPVSVGSAGGMSDRRAHGRSREGTLRAVPSRCSFEQRSFRSHSQCHRAISASPLFLRYSTLMSRNSVRYCHSAVT